jgi:hypothetical protein
MFRNKWLIGCLLLGLASGLTLSGSPAMAEGPHDCEKKGCDRDACPRHACCHPHHQTLAALHNLICGQIGRLMVLHSELGVTHEQKEKIHEVLVSHKNDIVKVVKHVWQERKELLDAVLAEKPKEKTIRKEADDLGHAIGDVAVLLSKMVGEVRPVFSTEQVDKIKKFRVESNQAVERFFDQASKTEAPKTEPNKKQATK